jgi:hypothetical protein
MHRSARSRSSDRGLAVLGVLLGEPLERGGRHHAGVHALLGELGARLDGQLDLGARRDEDHVGRAVRRILQDVRALARQLGRGELLGRPVVRRNVLARQREADGPVVALQRLEPGVRRLVRVGGAHDRKVRDRAERREVLDRLVGGTVLAEGDGVVRPDEDARNVHERRETNRGAHVVGELEEGPAVRAGLAVERDAVEDRRHGVLANTEVQHAAVRRTAPVVRRPFGRDERLGAVDRRVVRTGQVGGTAPELGELRREGVDDLAARGAGRDRAAALEEGEGLLDVLGERVRLEPVEERLALGVRGGPGVEARLPRGTRFGGAGCQLAGVRDDLVLDGERLLRVEAEHLLGRGDLICAEGAAVNRLRALLVRRGVADQRLEDDERGLARLGLAVLDRRVQRLDVLDVLARRGPVDVQHLPAVRLVAGGHVFRERDVRVALDRDLVRVVDRDQVAELLVARERGSLARHALLQIAVARDDIHEVVERALARGSLGVEEAALVARCIREADGRGETLSERTGRDLDAIGLAVLRVAGGLRTPGAERLEVVELESEPTEVQLHVLGEGGVAHREDEAFTSQPVRVCGVVVHDALVQQVRGGSQAHRRSRVPVANLLNGVSRQHACRVHGSSIDVVPTQFCHGTALPSVVMRLGSVRTGVVPGRPRRAFPLPA